MTTKGKRYPVEVRERAVRLVLEHRGEYQTEWAAITSIAQKCGMTAETLRKWVRQSEIDGGRRPGVSTAEAQRIKELERENKELRRANEILKAASAFFARELDPQPRRCRVLAQVRLDLQAPPSAIAEPAPGEQDHDHDDQQDKQQRTDGDSAEDGGKHKDDDEQLE
jgi:transposase